MKDVGKWLFHLNRSPIQLQLAGLTPILTHPERNATLQTDRARMMDWLRSAFVAETPAAGGAVGDDDAVPCFGPESRCSLSGRAS